jgi:hypothetical protein
VRYGSDQHLPEQIALRPQLCLADGSRHVQTFESGGHFREYCIDMLLQVCGGPDVMIEIGCDHTVVNRIG